MYMTTKKNITSFNAKGIVSFERQEFKIVRNWAQTIWHRWFGDEDIQTYNYTICMHVEPDLKVGDRIIVNDWLIMRVVDIGWMTPKLKTEFPTLHWLIFTDFKNARYGVFRRD